MVHKTNVFTYQTESVGSDFKGGFSQGSEVSTVSDLGGGLGATVNGEDVKSIANRLVYSPGISCSVGSQSGLVRLLLIYLRISGRV